VRYIIVKCMGKCQKLWQIPVNGLLPGVCKCGGSLRYVKEVEVDEEGVEQEKEDA